jgi:hypothetical protein
MQGELDSHHLIHFTYDPIKKEKKESNNCGDLNMEFGM